MSDYNVSWLQERFGAAAANVHRVYNGLEPEALPWTDPAGRDPGVLFVGRLVEKKGVPDLVDAIALLRDRGRPVPLTVAGTGPLTERVTEQVRRLGLDRLVTMPGPVSQHEVVALLGRAAVFAAPCVQAPDGDRDGLPTVLLEAMALGAPCVSTPVTGIPEAIEHGRTGLLVPERDAFALADAIATLLDDAGLRSRLARAARHHVEARFDCRDQAAALAALRTRAGGGDGDRRTTPSSEPARRTTLSSEPARRTALSPEPVAVAEAAVPA